MDGAKSACPHCDDSMMYSETGLRLHKSAVHKIFEVRHHQHHQDGHNDSDDGNGDMEFDSDDGPLSARIKCATSKCREMVVTEDTGEMLLCDYASGDAQVCNAGWHTNCLSGKHAITEKPEGKSYCPTCTQ